MALPPSAPAPDETSFLRQRAAGLRRNGEYDDAAQILRRLIELSRHSSDCVSLGAIERQRGNLQGALSAYTRGIDFEQREPTPNVALRTGLAFVLIDQGRHAAHCLELLKQSLTLDPGGASTHSIVAAAYRRLARRDRAPEHDRSAAALEATADQLGIDRERHRRAMKNLAEDLSLRIEDLVATIGTPAIVEETWTWPTVGTSTGNQIGRFIPIPSHGVLRRPG